MCAASNLNVAPQVVPGVHYGDGASPSAGGKPRRSFVPSLHPLPWRDALSLLEQAPERARAKWEKML